MRREGRKEDGGKEGVVWGGRRREVLEFDRRLLYERVTDSRSVTGWERRGGGGW